MNKKGNAFKRHFLTGLILILPLWLTYFILKIIYKLVAARSSGPVRWVWGLFSEDAPLEFLTTVISFFLTIVVIWGVGALASVGGKRLFKVVEDWLLRVPGVGGLYSTFKQVTHIAFVGKSEFRRVVLFEFPQPGMYAIGFVTNEKHWRLVVDGKEETGVSIFYPTTPNPTTGYLLVVPERKIIPTSMTPDEAFRVIVSAGIVSPERTVFR